VFDSLIQYDFVQNKSQSNIKEGWPGYSRDIEYE
jgi:hypothetical protein